MTHIFKAEHAWIWCDTPEHRHWIAKEVRNEQDEPKRFYAHFYSLFNVGDSFNFERCLIKINILVIRYKWRGGNVRFRHLHIVYFYLEKLTETKRTCVTRFIMGNVSDIFLHSEVVKTHDKLEGHKKENPMDFIPHLINKYHENPDVFMNTRLWPAPARVDIA